MSKKVIVCNCKGNILNVQQLEAIEKKLSGSGIEIYKITDLCGMCATQKEDIRNLFPPSDDVLVIACYPRAVKILLSSAGINGESVHTTIVNARESDIEKNSLLIQAFLKDNKQATSLSEIKSDPEWPSWFPAIDYARCSACGQCADFCLFGVYEKTDGKVFVINPKGCKNNCPACARICPQTAIVFPKYKQGGAIAGDDNIDEIAEQQRQREDLDSILGSDIYKTLEQRKAKRKAIIKAEAMNKALKERDDALNEKP
jgi:ferredoxin